MLVAPFAEGFVFAWPQVVGFFFSVGFLMLWFLLLFCCEFVSVVSVCSWVSIICVVLLDVLL